MVDKYMGFISRLNGNFCSITTNPPGISNQCGILVANAIIYFNSVLLSLILEKYESCNNNKAIERLKKISPVAWQHIHFLGHYMFCSNKGVWPRCM